MNDLKFMRSCNLTRKILIILIISVFVSIITDSAFVCAKTAKQKVDDKKTELKSSVSSSNVVDLESDNVQYFQDNETFVATGHVKMIPEGQDSVIEADKVTYERLNDVIVAEKNVKITQNKQVIYGDYARIDLNNKTSLIKQVESEINQIKIIAKTANIYPKKKDPKKKDVEAFDGKATMTDPNMIYMLSRSGSKFINQDNANPYNTSGYHDKNTEIKVQTNFKPSYHIHSKYIFVKRDKNAEIVTLKQAVITVNRYKIMTYPSLMLTSNKETKQVETNLPEIGSAKELGTYVGVGPVLCLPHGSTLKLAPIVTKGGKFGFGGMGRFMSTTNKTEMAYATSKKHLIINGEQKLPFISPFTRIQYGQKDYVDNGFFGRQLQQQLVEIVDERNVASAYNFNFDLRSSAGYIAQNAHWSTGKFQLQGNLYNFVPLYRIGKHVDLGANGQFAMSVYGSGDTYGVVRAGPTMAVSAGPLYTWVAYYQGGIYGETPVDIDRFYYGKSNVTWSSSYRINKYLTIGYNTSLNLAKDNVDAKMLAENQFYVWMGPNDLRFMVAYDARRNALRYDFNMLLGSDKSELAFDKLKVTEK